MPKSPDDTLVVHNIDVDCSKESVEYVRKIEHGMDEEGQHYSNENDVPYEFSHADGFQVRYGGNVFNIRPGETRRLPRYIAEHYAKHLIDHMLQKKSEDTGNPNLVNDINERKALLEQIIISEELLLEDYQSQNDNFDNVDNSRQSTILKEETIEVNDPLTGFEVKPQPTITLQDLKDAPNEEIKDGDKVRTRAELMAECKVLGIPVSRTDKTRDLLNKIKAF